MSDRFKPADPSAAAGRSRAQSAPHAQRGGDLRDPTAAAGREHVLRRRDALAREYAELQYDLGGLAYEMAVRDHWRIDVLVRRAAALQEVDAQLAGVERLAHTDAGAAVANCPACGALHARGAAFCAHCGVALLPT